MIWQRSPGMRPEVAKDGCYFMSILWHVSRHNPELPIGISDISHILYPEVVANGWMGEDCYIKHPDEIFGYMGMQVEYLGRFGADRVCRSDEFEINLWHYPQKNWYHFVAGDGSGITTYDPWGISTTATRGTLDSKRIFRIRE